MKLYITTILLAFSTVLCAQNIKKGFKSLEKSEYLKAKEAFQKNLASDSKEVGSCFGMALILADDKSPEFDIIDAWQYVERIEGRLGELSQDDIDVLSEYFLNTEVRRTSRPVKKKMEIALEAIEHRLIKYIREENNLEACYEVLERYPKFRHYDNVVHIRNQFEFRKYEKMNTLAAFDEFIAKFPDAAQVPKARKQRYKLAFHDAKTKNTVDAYIQYIMAFPESEYLQQAIKLRNAAAYKKAKITNTLAAYEQFIETYPDALEVSEARVQQQDILYEQAKRIKSMQAFNDFIKQYPDGKYFIDIFNLKASELGGKFVAANGINPTGLQWARGFDNNGSIESGGIVKPTSDGGLIAACNTRDNDSAFADTWIIKLDAAGKMQWNKTIGQAFEDSVSNILITSNNDIIVVGYTHLSADSASKMGWMFKLAADGKKLWNKNLGKINIQSSAIDNNDRIYIGGGIAKDTLGVQYAITTFTSKANKVGEKVYTGRGIIDDISINTAQDMMLVGSNWLSNLQLKRYIKWEAQVDTQFTITHSAYAEGVGYYFAGYNNNTIVYGLFSESGTKVWFQNYDKTDASHEIKAVGIVDNTDFAVLEQKATDKKIKIFTPQGNIKGIKQFSNQVQLVNCTSGNTGTMLVLNNGDFVILKLTSIQAL